MSDADVVRKIIDELQVVADQLYALAHDTRSPKPDRAKVRKQLRADLATILEAL